MMNNSTLYVLYKRFERDDGPVDEPVILGVYSTVEKADTVAVAQANHEISLHKENLSHVEMNPQGLKMYVVEYNQSEERTIFEVSARVLDADPPVSLGVQSAQVVASASNMFISRQSSNVQQTKQHRQGLRQQVDKALADYARNPHGMPQSMSIFQSGDPWEKFQHDVLVWSGISFVDPDLEYAKAYIQEKATVPFTAYNQKYLKIHRLIPTGRKSATDFDRELDDQLQEQRFPIPGLQLPTFLPPGFVPLASVVPPPSFNHPLLNSSSTIPTHRSTVEASSLQSKNNQQTIEEEVENYIKDRLLDYDDSQEWIRGLDANQDKVAVVKGEIIKYLTEGLATEITDAYWATKAYADAYIADRARAFVAILDPLYSRKIHLIS